MASAATKLLPHSDETKTYSRRWLMLILFCLCIASNTFQWTQLQHNVEIAFHFYYYKTAASFSTWLDLSYIVTCLITILPATYLLHVQGLRTTLLLGSFVATLGVGIRVFSVARNRWDLLLLSQLLEGFSGAFFFVSPPRLAAIWFGPNQVSTACGFGLMSAQVGILIGTTIPPLVLTYVGDGNLSGFQNNLQGLHCAAATASTVLLFLVWACFESEPPTPSDQIASMSKEINLGDHEYKNSVGQILRNRNVWYLLFAYVILQGVNQSLITFIPAFEAQDTYKIYPLNVGANVFGGVLNGIWLDKTCQFRETNFTLYLIFSIGLTGYVICYFYASVVLIQVFFVCIGFTCGAYTTLVYEYEAELAFHDPEGTTSGLISLFYFLSITMFEYVPQMFGISAMSLSQLSFIITLILLGLLAIMCIREK